MFGNVTKPAYSRRFESNVPPKALCHGLIDNCQFFVVEKLYEPPLCLDKPSDSLVDMVQKTDDGGLFENWWAYYVNTS